MDDLRQAIVHSRGDGLSSPCGGATSSLGCIVSSICQQSRESLPLHGSPSHTQAVAQAIAVAPQSLHNSVVQPVDLFYIGKFLGTAQDDLPGLKTAMIDEVCEAPFTLVSKQTADALPHLLLLKEAGIFV